MPKLIASPTQIPVPGNKIIDEYIGRVNSGDTQASRKVLRREAAILAALAIAGAVIEYPLALALKSLDRSELVRALPFLGVTIVLASLAAASRARSSFRNAFSSSRSRVR